VDASAWLLHFGDGESAVVGERELLHLVPQPTLLMVPRAPAHCRRVMEWQNRLLPTWDVLEWLSPGAGERDARLAAVVGYQLRRKEMPRFGAVMLEEPPSRVKVSDTQACELPGGRPGLRDIAISCFLHEQQPVPVLDLPRMFARAMAIRAGDGESSSLTAALPA
jgi:hypothetical protein